MAISGHEIKQLAADCGFELAGIAAAAPHRDFERFEGWRAHGLAGEMAYLNDRRGDLRRDPKHLLPGAKSMVCVGKLYNTQAAHTNARADHGSISCYAWGADYHDVVREALNKLVERIGEQHGEPFNSRVCVDTAPLLERSYARQAGLGWIGRNTCLINQQQGSWFFLGEVLLSIPLAPDQPPPDRCGTCRRCIDACPTHALVPEDEGGWRLDARRCISYLTVERRGPACEPMAFETGNHLFGCDICQDVCPWNVKAPVTGDEPFQSSAAAERSLADWAQLGPEQFRDLFRHSPIWRAKYEGFLRNVAVALGNAGDTGMLEPLDSLRSHPHAVVRESAERAYEKLLASVRGDNRRCTNEV